MANIFHRNNEETQTTGKVKFERTFGSKKSSSKISNPLLVKIEELKPNKKGELIITLVDDAGKKLNARTSNKNLLQLLEDPLIIQKLPIPISIFSGFYRDGLNIDLAILDSDFPVSASLFNKYKHCPRLIYINDYLSTWQMMEFPLARGNLVHELLGKLYPKLKDSFFESKESLRELVMDVVNSTLHDNWYIISSVGLTEAEAIKKIIQPERLVDSIWYNRDLIWGMKDQKYYSEVRVQSPLYGLKGVIDRIEENENGIAIAEIKTGKKFPDKISSAFLQAAVYGLILDQTTNNKIGLLKVELPDIDFDQRFEFEAYNPESTIKQVIPIRNDIYYYLTGGCGDEHSIAPFKRCKPFCYSREACEFYCRIDRLLKGEENICDTCSHRKGSKNYDPCIFPNILTTKNIEIPYSYYNWYRQQLDQIRLSIIENQKFFYQNPEIQEKIGNGFANLQLIDQKSVGSDHVITLKKIIEDKEKLIPPTRLREGERILITPNNQIPLSEYSVFGNITEITHEKLVIFMQEAFPEKNLEKAYDKNTKFHTFRIDNFPLDTVSRQKQALDILFRGSFFNNPKHFRLFFGINRLQELLYFIDKPKVKTLSKKLPSNLNESQKKAVLKSIQADDFHMIQGPPGSGKTTVICEIALEVIKTSKKGINAYGDYDIPLLITAFTNRAADNIVKKLHNKTRDEDVIRIGNITNILDEEVRTHTLDYLTKKSSDRSAKAQKLIQSAKIIVTTNLSSTSPQLQYRFDMAIVDEASQSSEPMTLLPIIKANRFVLVGDHIQLPPVISAKVNPPILSLELRKQLLINTGDTIKLSMFERLMRKYKNNPDIVTFLDTQYRMNDKILSFAKKFYTSEIFSHKSVKDRTLDNFYDKHDIGCSVRGIAYKIFEKEKPIVFIDTKNKNWMEEQSTDMRSKFNPLEAEFISKFLFDYLIGLRPMDIERLIVIAENLGITTTYRAQVGEIRKNLSYLLSKDNKNSNYKELMSKILIDTVDRFQGREKEIMIISMSDSNEDRQVGDLNKDKRRINVAITRGKSKVIIVGNSETLITEKFYEDLYNYISSIDGVIILE